MNLFYNKKNHIHSKTFSFVLNSILKQFRTLTVFIFLSTQPILQSAVIAIVCSFNFNQVVEQSLHQYLIEALRNFLFSKIQFSISLRLTILKGVKDSKGINL